MHPEPSPPDLGTLQRWLSGVVRETDTEPMLADSFVIPNDRMSAIERVDVYRRGYSARLIGALEVDFPGLAHALGAAEFDDLCAAYVDAHPSRNPNLNAFSEHMVEFLDGRHDLEHREFARDLARLESAMLRAFHAEAADTLDPDAFSKMTPTQWGSLVIRTDPSLSLVESRYPVNRFLQAVFDESDPTIPEPDPSFTAVYRKDSRVWRTDLSHRGFATLSAIARGEPFARALEHAGDEADHIGRWFRDWAAEGLFRGLDI